MRKVQAENRQMPYNYIHSAISPELSSIREGNSVPAMTDHPIAVITFDLGNVLVKVDHLEFCRRLATAAGTTPEEVYATVFASHLEPRFDTGRLSPQEFFQQIRSHYQLHVSFEEFAAWWNSIFSPMPEMAGVVDHLAGRYPLFLLSNTNALHFHYIREQYPFLDRFTRFVLSYEVGSRKPEPEIYRHLIRQADTAPERLLFIDDKLPFVQAAREQGLQAWQFPAPQHLVRQLQEAGVW